MRSGMLRMVKLPGEGVQTKPGGAAPELLGRSPMVLRDRYGRAEPILTTGGKAVLSVPNDF